MHPAAALLILLALTQAVFCSFFAVNFSQVRQCGSFQVNFTGVPGTAPPALPLTLTVVPFSSNPILIPIPIGTWDNTTFKGAAEISFLPFYGGKQFVASLDDANGQGMGLVSDVIGVQPSSDSSCLPMKQGNNNHGGSNKEAKTDFYDLKGNFAQCSPFNVTFDEAQVARAPSIRAFLPRSFSFPVNKTTDPSTPGNQEYMLDIFHGTQAVLLMDDDAGHQETSGLFTTGGDIASSTKCFPFLVPNQTAQVGAADTSAQHVTVSKDAKIIVAVSCVAVVIVVAIVMAMIIQRKRIHSRQLRSPYSSTKSFIFTEDVDMGSTFIGRIRGHLSQFLGSNHSASGEKRSNRMYFDDEKGEMPFSYEGSYGIPTSPRGSLAAPPSSRPVSDVKSPGPSWIDVERMLDESYYRKASQLLDTFKTSPSNDSIVIERESRVPAPPFPLPIIDPPPAARTRDSAPDAPLPAIPRSPSSDYRYRSSSATDSFIPSERRQTQRDSGSSFGNLIARVMSMSGSSESSFGNDLSDREYTHTRSFASSLRSSQFAFPLARVPGERLNAARVSPFPTTPIGSRRTSRTSR